MRARFPRLVLVGVVGAALACSSVESRVVRIGPSLRALPSGARVEVLHAPLTTPGAREVGIVELTGYDDADNAATWTPRLQELARQMGGNAVVVMRTDRARGFVRVIASIVRVP